jgi:hypothetical protein
MMAGWVPPVLRLAPRTRLVLLAAVLGLLAGCNIVGPLSVLFAPRRIQKTQFKLTTERLAVFVDYARTEEESPVFTQALYDRLAQVFRERKINDQLVPLTEVQKLRQAHSDFSRWSIQKVGRELDAPQTLYIRVDRLVLRPAANHPILEPSVELRLKVIGTDEAADMARLWPGNDERDGRVITRKRQPTDQVDPVTTDREATKLGRDAALLVAMPFYDVDQEETVPWEK